MIWWFYDHETLVLDLFCLGFCFILFFQEESSSKYCCTLSLRLLYLWRRKTVLMDNFWKFFPFALSWMKLFSFFFPWIPLLEYVTMYNFGLEFYLFSHCWYIWTIKYTLSFDTGSVILVLMALITYWNKKKNTLSERSVVLYWRSVTKNTSVHAVNNQLLLEDCCKLLKIWQSLWLLNDCFELFVLVPILYKLCHETATEHLSDFTERPSSSDF